MTERAATAEVSASTLWVPARGRLVALKDGVLVFAPSGTNYQLRLMVGAEFSAAVGALVEGVVRVAARKVWTVSSGGNFIAPIFGPPRTLQGKVRALGERTLLVQAGLPVAVDLPEDPTAYELAHGPIRAGAMVNVMALPGARFEPVDGKS